MATLENYGKLCINAEFDLSALCATIDMERKVAST